MPRKAQKPLSKDEAIRASVFEKITELYKLQFRENQEAGRSAVANASTPKSTSTQSALSPEAEALEKNIIIIIQANRSAYIKPSGYANAFAPDDPHKNELLYRVSLAPAASLLNYALQFSSYKIINAVKFMLFEHTEYVTQLTKNSTPTHSTLPFALAMPR